MVRTVIDLETFVNTDINSAFRKVIAYNITDIFDLTVEETMWLQRELISYFPDLSIYSSNSIPLAVKKELEEKKYTSMLSQRALSESARGSSITHKTGTIPERKYWVMLFLSSLESSYKLPANITLQLHEMLDRILSELGVSAKDNPRGATKMPAELRLLLR
jgi:hypothetical protein